MGVTGYENCGGDGCIKVGVRGLIVGEGGFIVGDGVYFGGIIRVLVVGLSVIEGFMIGM